MPKLLLDIPDLKKAKDFLTYFVPYLTFIEEAQIIEEENDSFKNQEDKLLYEPKDNYTVEDIEGIIAHFPEDYHWTSQDLEKYFPQDLKIKVEIINNQIFVMPSPNSKHQIISDELIFQFNLFIRKHNLGRIIAAPMDTKFDENNVFQPDIMFVAISSYEIIKENYIEGSPNLVVEIWSPSNSKEEGENKQKEYEKNKVTEYWQIEPKEKAVLIETLDKNNKYETFSEAKEDGIVKSKVLEGFEIDVKDIFPKVKTEE